jgi:hypothetical protein
MALGQCVDMELPKLFLMLRTSIVCKDSKRMNVAYHDSKEASRLEQLTRLSKLS